MDAHIISCGYARNLAYYVQNYASTIYMSLVLMVHRCTPQWIMGLDMCSATKPDLLEVTCPVPTFTGIFFCVP